MAQRLTLRRRLSYNTNSNRRKVVKTPGGKLTYHYVKKAGTFPKCGDCKIKLNGIVPARPKEWKRMSRRLKTVSRAYGGSQCPRCLKERVVRAFLIEEQKIVSKVLKAQQAQAPFSRISKMLRYLAVAALVASSAAFVPAFENAAKQTQALKSPLFKVPSAPTNPSASITQLEAMLTQTELPEKLYFEKEAPKVLGGLQIGLRKLVVVTGASSGLGLNAAATLAKTGRYFVIMACRDTEKAKRVAKEMKMPEGSYLPMKLELGSLQSVRDFVANLKAFKSARPLNHLICNAAVYRPTDPEPAFTDDGFEMSMGVNHFGHFLLVNLLLDDMSRAKGARCCIVGSITGNTNTVGGGLVYPQADLGKLQGFEKGAKFPITMADGKPFFGAKAYKDSKVCNMMTVSELHDRYHESTGIIFSSMYPGCIAETNLFREKRPWFRTAFPWFMKYVTGGYVGEQEAGERLAQVIDDPQCTKSNVYWSWNGGAKTVGRWDVDGKPKGAGGSGGTIFENDQSDAVRDKAVAQKMWDLSVKAVGLSEKEMCKAKK